MFDDKKFKLITKKNLAAACRKFVSRYLVSTRKDTDYNENMDLSVNLTRFEFWPDEIVADEDKFGNEISFLKKLKITTGQCFELYNLMGGDETDELKGIKIKKEEIEQEEENNDDFDDDDDEDDDNIGGRVRRKKKGKRM